MDCNCNRNGFCAGEKRGAFGFNAPEVSRFRVTLSPAYLAQHTGCGGGCLLLVGGRYRCGAFSADAVKNQKPYCPYGYGVGT